MAILEDLSSVGLELEVELGLIARDISESATGQAIWAGKYEEYAASAEGPYGAKYPRAGPGLPAAADAA